VVVDFPFSRTDQIRLTSVRSARLAIRLLSSARLYSERKLQLVERGPVFLGPGLCCRLQRLEELPLLFEAKLEVLAGRGEASPVSFDRDSLRNGDGRYGGLGPELELRDEKVRPNLRNSQTPIGEEETNGWHQGRA
jgi:hypothetical protein